MYQLMSDFPTVNKMPVTTAPMTTSPHSRLPIRQDLIDGGEQEGDENQRNDDIQNCQASFGRSAVPVAQAYYDLNTTVFTMSKSGPVSKGANIVIAPTTADTVVNERPSSSIFAV